MKFSGIFIIILSTSIIALSQNKSPVSYQSADDASLTITKIFVAPFYDNQSNIYAPAMTAHIRKQISSENQWSVEPTDENMKVSDALDSTESERVSLMKKFSTQALLTSKIIKGPKGLSLKMTLYTGVKSWPLIQESIDQIQNFEIEEIKKSYDLLWDRIRKKMPYNGTILSRRGSDVTINLGSQNGLKVNSEVRAVIILKVNRHPKLQFMTSVEKEILGKIKITKIDEYLSFGTIVYEKDMNLLTAGMKIQADEMDRTALVQSPNQPANKAFGENPKEWLPLHPPQYGMFGVALGMNQYSQSANLTNFGNLSAVNNFAPTIRLNADFWLNEEWIFAFGLRQTALSISNGLTGSGPEKLNMSLSQINVAAAYNFLITNQVFGPKFQFSFGLNQYRAQVDPSTPTAFTSMNYGGLNFGFSGSFPLSDEEPWDLGAKFKYYWSPSTTESTASGAVTSTKINDFSIFTRYRRSQNFAYIGELGFEYYSTDFDSSGATRPNPATSISHKVTNMLLGLEYYF